MLDRKDIIEQAYNECLTEMYAKAQPPADFKALLEECKNNPSKRNENFYEHHYLSQAEFNHISEKYMGAYGIKEHWNSDIEILEDFLNKGGLKDKYIESRTDEYGHYHPGYRGCEKVAPIASQIQEILKTEIGEGNVTDKISNKITECVMNTIKDCKHFYHFDREKSSFMTSVALGCSPTSNPQSVIDFWKSQGVDIDIKEPNPLLLWDRDFYGDKFEEVMEDEYGENWEEYWNNKWKERQASLEEERKKKFEELYSISGEEFKTNGE